MTAEPGTQRAIRRGIAWTTVASVVMGVFDVAATVLLLRFWLGPEDYGIAAIATTLFPMLDLVADAGIAGKALAQGLATQRARRSGRAGTSGPVRRWAGASDDDASKPS